MRSRGWKVGCAAAALVLSGCFLGYDSRWGDQKRAQRNFARAQTPKAVRALPSGASSARTTVSATKTLRLRLYATRAYSSQVLDWQRRFEETLAEVNRVFTPALGVRLEIAEAKFWPAKTADDAIDGLLAELRQLDDGEDVDWVVGLVGSVPRFEQSFHELGVADVIGEHLIVRSINNVAEHQAFEAGLGELSQAERERLSRARLSHKVTTLLLHELGHTLGAIHERDRSSLMNPSYSHQEEGFSSAAVDLMQVALRSRGTKGGLDAAGVEAMLSVLQREPSPWIPAEREAALARLGRASPAPRSPDVPAAGGGPTRTSTASLAPSPTAPPAAALAALSPADRKTFEEAQRLRQSGDLAGAHRLALPLFEAYPRLEAVQDFRCQLALQRGGAWAETRAECEGLMKLSPHRSGK
jgi:hypothetical protein